MLARKTRWKHENAERLRLTRRSRRMADLEKSRAKGRLDARRRRSTPKGRIENAIRAAVYAEITKGSKRGRKTFALLGYTSDQLRRHIERQFLPGMSWANYGTGKGKWHIDHIVPLASFEYEAPDAPEFNAAWALTNLRPLWDEDNRKKRDKRIFLI